jgi:hypothetical protein
MKFVFVLSPPNPISKKDRVYFLAASNEQEMFDWVSGESFITLLTDLSLMW